MHVTMSTHDINMGVCL